MAESTTTHYSFTQPEIGGSADTWGTKLNVNFGLADAALNGLSTSKLAKSSNLLDLADKPAARANLGLLDAATKATGTTAGTVAAGDDGRITGAAQKAANLSDMNAATARDNLGLKSAATRDVGATSIHVAAGDDSRITGALQKSLNLSDLTDAGAARTSLGLLGLSQLASVTNAHWTSGGADLAVENGGTGASTASAARSNLGLGDAATKSGATILSEMTKANVDAALGKTAARVVSGSAANSGLISWGSGEPPELHEGQIYLRHA